MAWNEPGGGKNKDPWSGGNRNNNNGGGPPDLDEIWRRLRSRLTGNNRGSGRGGSGGGGNGSGGISGGLVAVVAVVVIAVWLFSGLYVIQPGEKGVVLRFGKYIQTVGSGWHWRPPYPIGMVYTVDTQKVRTASIRGVMLTKHENYVAVEVAVQYRVSNAMYYLFQLQHPDQTVRQVLRSVVRQIVGGSTLSQVIQEGVGIEDLETETAKKIDMQKSKENKNEDTKSKEQQLATVEDEVAQKVKQQQSGAPEITKRSRATLDSNIRRLMQYRLEQYRAGINILAVNVKYAQPPEPVQGAFQEAIRAREQKASKKNKARAYARAVIERAQGEKAQRIAQAKAYKARKIQRAKGNVARFTKLAEQYQKAPETMRTRLYLQTMGEVLADSHLILNAGDQSSMNYLPLGQLFSMQSAGQKSHGRSEYPASSGNSRGASTLTLPAQSGTSDGMGSSGADNSRSRARNR